MAVLDGLLHAVARAPGGALRLSPGEAPELVVDGTGSPLSSTKLDAASIMSLLGEVAPQGRSTEDMSISLSFNYAYDGVVFEFWADPTPQGWVATARRITVEPVVDKRPVEAAQPAPCPTPATPGRVAAFQSPSARSSLGTVDTLLAMVKERGASDLHLVAGQEPRLRVDGALRPVDGLPVPTAREVEELLATIMEERNRNEFRESNDSDFALESGGARFRVNVFRDRLGPGAVFRLIPLDIPTFEDLGLPECLREICRLNKGLVLVTGPTGSGKSTTLAAMIDTINRTREDHIITIEDPVEFVHTSDRCLINQREVGVHTGSFKRALRAALREDPDIVLVGEMRDLETVSMAIETAATGHLVFGTLHTTTAPSTIERIIGQFPGELQEQTRMMLSDSLRGVVAQTLLKRSGGGRVAAFEILLGTPAVSNIIREGKTHQLPSAIQTGGALGMTSLTDSLFNLIRERVIEVEEGLKKATDKEALAKKLAQAGVRVPSRTLVEVEAAEPPREDPMRALG